jgi:SAM-dependent methyltransferase
MLRRRASGGGHRTLGAASVWAEPRKIKRIEDCHFYHRMEIPGHGLVGGEWDLAGGEDDYLGHVELAGRRVLEIGPANGYLTFFMESRGAEVVAVELAPETDRELVPHVSIDLEQLQAQTRTIMERLRNAFWFAHERLESAAKVHYGSAYDLPEELGHFDVAVLAAVLLHTRDPLRIVENCARIADCVVVTDIYHPTLDGVPAARFAPAADSDASGTWWDLSPDLMVRFLGVLGFADATVSYHAQKHIAGGVEIPMPLFTVRACKGPAGRLEP